MSTQLKKLYNVKDFEDLFYQILWHYVDLRVPGHFDVHLVSSPISASGGLGNKTTNMMMLELSINYLESQGKHVFPSTLLEETFRRLTATMQSDKQKWQAICDFYTRLIQHRENGQPFFKSIIVNPLWRSSSGARCEVNAGLQYNVPIDETSLSGFRFLNEPMRLQLLRDYAMVQNVDTTSVYTPTLFDQVF